METKKKETVAGLSDDGSSLQKKKTKRGGSIDFKDIQLILKGEN